MADVRISALPQAQAITGTELVPVVQNGLTVQTTVAAISASPNQTQPFLTVSQQPTLPNSRYLSAINGLQIADGGAQNPLTLSIVTNPTIPGTAGMAIPSGTTAQRNTTPAAVRFNTDLTAFEGYNGTAWAQFLTGGVTTFSAGTTGFAPSVPTTGAITLSGILNAASGGTGAASLNGYLFGNGASPATASTTIPTADLSGLITNAQLVNSAITINGTSVALGGSAVVPLANPLTIGTGLSGTSFNGSAPVTIAIDNTGVTAGVYGTSNTYPIITVNAQGQVTNVATGAVPNTYQGTWNASTNSPTLTSSVGVAGYYYIVSTAGSTNLNGITSWAVGDWAAFNGSVWQKIAGTSTGTFASLTVTGVATLNQVTFGGSAGTSGYFLTSAGAGGTPTWVQGVSIADIGYAANQIPLNQYLGRLAYQDALSAGDDGSQVFVGVSDVGIGANQVPLNQYLGSMAYQSRFGANIVLATIDTLTTTNDATISGLAVGKGGGAVATNTAVGLSVLNANTTGVNNAGFGYQTLIANTTGNSNAAFGYRALFTNTTGGNNTAVGTSALTVNLGGLYNQAFGSQTLVANTSGSGNAAVGYGALSKNTTGANNTAVGGVDAATYAGTLSNNLTGNFNVAVGGAALRDTTASNNTALGWSAGNTLTTGTNNTLIGYNAAPSAITVSNQITLGDTNVTSFRIPGLTITAGAKWINVGSSTVAGLPAAATAGLGARAFVTDALTPTFGATVTGGGAVATPVYSDGTNWKVG